MPNRIIKESVCTSESIDQMSWFEEVFFHRLWTACDDYGRMDARPAILKSKLFPLKDRLSLKDIQNALQKMADIGCVRLYECDSKPYLYLPSWEVHQQVRAKKSKYPAPGESCNQMISDDITCSRNPIQSESESNTKESSASAPRTFVPPSIEDVETVCKENGYHFSPEAFVAYYESNGWKVGRNKMKNWRKALVTWETRWKEDHGGNTRQAVGGPRAAGKRDWGIQYDVDGREF